MDISKGRRTKPTSSIHALITPDVKHRLEAAAAAREVTVSIALRWAIREWLERNEAAA